MDWYKIGELSMYIGVCASYGGAALLVHRRTAADRSNYAGITRLKSMSLKRWLAPPHFEAIFEESGYPLKLTAYRYQLVRFGIVALWLVNSALDMWEMGAPLNLPAVLLKVIGPAIFLLLTHRKASVFTYVIGKWKEMYDGEKNRELFMVYNMIADEMKEQGHRKLNLLSMLTKLRDYTMRIKPSINRGLRRFDEGPHAAMMTIAEDIGTREAHELCKLLADLEMTKTDDIAALVTAREESYTNLLRENRRRRRKFFGHIAYAIAFMPLLIYLWNALHMAQQYVTDLARTTSQLG